MAARRPAARDFQAAGIRPDRFVSLDPTWAKTNMTRRYGWAPTRERSAGAVPHGHGMTTTFVGASRSAGPVAPRVVDGAMNGAIFRAHVGRQLVRAWKPGDRVVLGHLSRHTAAGVREAVAAAGPAVVSRPPCSPDRNPIEHVLAKAKAELRKRQPRTKAACDARCGEVPDGLPPDERRNDIRHAGYVPQESD